MRLAPEQLRERIACLEELHDTLDQLYEETEGEVTETAAELERFLEDESDATADAAAWWLRECKAMADAAKKEAQRLTEVQKRAEARASKAKSIILDLLKRRKLQRLKLPSGGLAYRQKGRKRLENTGGTPVELLPERFQSVSIKADTAAIKKAIEGGEVVDGFEVTTGPETVVVK